MCFGEVTHGIKGLKTRAICLKVTFVPMLLLFALVYEDMFNGVMFNDSAN